MATPRFLVAILLVLFIGGCSAEQAKTPAENKANSAANKGLISHSQVDLPPASKQQEPNTHSITPEQTKVTEPDKAAKPVPLQPVAAPDPIIVQSQVAEDADADVVLNDISQELDSLTQVLKDLESSESTWNQEVTEP